MDAFRHANELMEIGRRSEAEAILDHALSEPLSDDDYEGAVIAYLAGHEYDKALSLYQRYEAQTGRDLSQVVDWKQADIEAERVAYQEALVVTPQAADGELQTVTLLPLSPVNVFLVLFIIIGTFFLGEVLLGKLHGIAINLLGIGMGLFMGWSGIKGFLTYIKSDEAGLNILAARFQPSGWGLKGIGFFALPQRQRIPYSDIKTATVKLYTVNRGQGAGLKLAFQNDRIEIIGLAPPFRVSDCEKLVINLRAGGVHVFVQPRALDKHFK